MLRGIAAIQFWLTELFVLAKKKKKKNHTKKETLIFKCELFSNPKRIK